MSEAKNKPSKYIALSGSDFTAPPAPRKQAVVFIAGLSGHGKSTFGLTYAPGPVTFFDVDKRGRHAAQRAQRKGKIIHYLPIDMPRKVLRLTDQDLKKLAEKELNKVRKNVEISAREGQKGNVRTAVFDTMTEFGSLVNMAITGRMDKKKDDFGKSTHMVKAIVKEIIEIYRESPVNLIMLMRAKELWVGSAPTGKYTYQGLDTVEYESDWGAHLRLAKDKKTKLHRSQKHEMEIIKAGIDLTQLGEVYTEEDWAGMGPFVYACYQNDPESEPEDWV